MKNKKGFTLIELLLVLGLLGIVIAMIFSPFIISSRTFDSQNEKTDIISESRYAMDYLGREIRKADIVEVIDNTLILDGESYKLEAGSLMKADKVIARGIDRIDIDKKDDKLEIEISVRDKKNKEHILSSTIYIR